MGSFHLVNTKGVQVGRQRFGLLHGHSEGSFLLSTSWPGWPGSSGSSCSPVSSGSCHLPFLAQVVIPMNPFHPNSLLVSAHSPPERPAGSRGLALALHLSSQAGPQARAQCTQAGVGVGSLSVRCGGFHCTCPREAEPTLLPSTHQRALPWPRQPESLSFLPARATGGGFRHLLLLCAWLCLSLSLGAPLRSSLSIRNILLIPRVSSACLWVSLPAQDRESWSGTLPPASLVLRLRPGHRGSGQRSWAGRDK